MAFDDRSRGTGAEDAYPIQFAAVEYHLLADVASA